MFWNSVVRVLTGSLHSSAHPSLHSQYYLWLQNELEGHVVGVASLLQDELIWEVNVIM